MKGTVCPFPLYIFVECTGTISFLRLIDCALSDCKANIPCATSFLSDQLICNAFITNLFVIYGVSKWTRIYYFILFQNRDNVTTLSVTVCTV